MSLCQWNTSLVRKQLAKITTPLALYQVNNGSSEMEEELMSDSSSSSGTSSSSSSPSASSASDMDLDQTTQIDPVLLKLIVTMTTLNEKINGTVSEDGISWGCTPTIMDLSELDAVKDCCLHKVDLCTLTESSGLLCWCTGMVIETRLCVSTSIQLTTNMGFSSCFIVCLDLEGFSMTWKKSPASEDHAVGNYTDIF